MTKLEELTQLAKEGMLAANEDFSLEISSAIAKFRDLLWKKALQSPYYLYMPDLFENNRKQLFAELREMLLVTIQKELSAIPQQPPVMQESTEQQKSKKKKQSTYQKHHPSKKLSQVIDKKGRVIHIGDFVVYGDDPAEHGFPRLKEGDLLAVKAIEEFGGTTHVDARSPGSKYRSYHRSDEVTKIDWPQRAENPLSLPRTRQAIRDLTRLLTERIGYNAPIFRLHVCSLALSDHRKQKRVFAHTIHLPDTICVDPSIETLPDPYLYGIMAHEFGHILAMKQTGRSSEKNADDMAKQALGVTIHYGSPLRLEYLDRSDLKRAMR